VSEYPNILLAHKLQNYLNNTYAQLELEKASSLAKDNRIKSLEEIIIELGHDPKDPKCIQALIRKKEEDIAALRKQLKLPITMHPKTTEIVEQKSQEDAMELLMKMNERLEKKEKALEEALQGKQGELASQPYQIAPIVTVTSSTVTTAVPPTLLASIAPSTSTTIAAGNNTTMTTEELIKAMEDLRFQVSELKGAKEKLAKLEVSYDKSKIIVAEKTREVKALENKVKALEKDLLLYKPLVEIRSILWANIGQSITDMWKSIQIIHE